MRPGKLEEFIFFDHPSGYNRIHSAMLWKSENLELFEKKPCESTTSPSSQ
jgi:STE24 endopeptidase